MRILSLTEYSRTSIIWTVGLTFLLECFASECVFYQSNWSENLCTNKHFCCGTHTCTHTCTLTLVWNNTLLQREYHMPPFLACKIVKSSSLCTTKFLYSIFLLPLFHLYRQSTRTKVPRSRLLRSYKMMLDFFGMRMIQLVNYKDSKIKKKNVSVTWVTPYITMYVFKGY